MSFTATAATYRVVLPVLAQRLQEVEPKRRPDFAKTALVALLLADKHQDRRGYANESVEQISEALTLSTGTVRNALNALDVLGFWVKVGNGNRHAPAKRVPSFLEGEPDPTVKEDVEGEADPNLYENLERGVEAPRARGNGSRAWGQPRDTPPTTPDVTPDLSSVVTTGATGDDDLIESHIQAHIDWKRTDPKPIEKPAAFTRWARPEMAAVVAEARAEGEDPKAWLEAEWPTGPDLDAGEFDPGRWEAKSMIDLMAERRARGELPDGPEPRVTVEAM